MTFIQTRLPPGNVSFLDNAELVFERPEKNKKSEADIEKDRMLKTIGQQKIDLDFLKRALS